MLKEEFLKKYPASLPELLTSPCIFRENLFFMKDLPYPGMNHMRDIGEYAHFSYGALRTACSVR